MKKALLKTFHIFMALVVLISSTGFGLVEHSCTMRGKTTTFHKADGSCCLKKNNKTNSRNNKTQIQRSACCSEQDKYENIEYSSSISQLVAKFVQKTTELIHSIVFQIVKTVIETISETIAYFFQNNSNLVYSGQKTRILHQSFLI